MKYITELGFKHTCSLDQFIALTDEQLAKLMRDALGIVIRNRNKGFTQELNDVTIVDESKA